MNFKIGETVQYSVDISHPDDHIGTSIIKKGKIVEKRYGDIERRWDVLTGFSYLLDSGEWVHDETWNIKKCKMD